MNVLFLVVPLRHSGVMLKWLDLPPIWLALFVLLTWRMSFLIPIGFPWPVAFSKVVAVLFVVAGAALTLAAAQAFRQSRTTIIPHQTPTALITTGIYARSRNPIYLADALILTGAVLWWNVAAAAVLVPAFCWLITRRFIAPEETRMMAVFGEKFTEYAQKTRRWA
ncbi:MAG: isoprenylcysteine carboxylmethyltransferase family protein [Rhodobacteraceae bacterium]|nr:isoprenylcysteine carboxylmethyltransferase family protein [Paracoccaceae bacterium]